MKLLIFFLFSSLLFSKAPLAVPYVDVEKFSGLWYEMARTYNSYEKDCVAATVEYRLEDKNSYQIYNRCFDKKIGGELIEYEGVAKTTDGQSMSKMDMTYFYLFTREYRVIHLENDYSLAVICDEEMDQVWIMSRKPTITKVALNTALAKLEPYMDLKRLIYTPQDEEGRYK